MLTCVLVSLNVLKHVSKSMQAIDILGIWNVFAVSHVEK